MAIVTPPKQRRGERPMIGTNRDITAMREAVEYELFRFQALNAVVRARLAIDPYCRTWNVNSSRVD
jgi:hypothetical protein